MIRQSKLLTLLTVILFSISGDQLFAQQYPQFTQFMLNRYSLNPAYGGLESSLSITTGLRTQWTPFEGAPKTQFVNAHLPLYILNGSVGMSVENEQLGAFKRLLMTMSYNYVYESSIGLISVGVKAGGQQVRIDGLQLRTPTGIYVDQNINHNDPLLASQNMMGISPQWGIGLYLVNEYFQSGFSIENIPANSFNSGAATYSPSKFLNLFLSSDIYVSDILMIRPVVLIKSDLVQTQTDAGALLYYDKFFGGITVRGYSSDSFDAFNIIAGIKMNEHFRLSYSFDFGISEINRFHDGTHEFVVNYNLNKKISTGELPRIIYNPRFN
jgi:type IX secretion system PorP/SprF family membrane protein